MITTMQIINGPKLNGIMCLARAVALAWLEGTSSKGIDWHWCGRQYLVIGDRDVRMFVLTLERKLSELILM